MNQTDNMKIMSFSGDFDSLSNFYPCPVEMDGKVYPTVEHAFQAAKTSNPAERQSILCAAKPGQAKRLGRKVLLRPDWESVKLGIMEDLLRKKFSDPALRELLLLTKGFELVEGNTWNDTFWGVCRGKGHNHLGRLLMKVRDTL